MAEMQSILTTLTARRNMLLELREERPRGAAIDPVLTVRIDLLNTAITALHHYDAPDEKIREALKP